MNWNAITDELEHSYILDGTQVQIIWNNANDELSLLEGIENGMRLMANGRLLREFGTREIRYINYRVADGLLVGQGWEQRRPTLPKSYVSKARPKVLVFFTFELYVWGKPMDKNYTICQ